MLLDFFTALRHAQLPVSVREYLQLLDALKMGVIGPGTAGHPNDNPGSMDDFYFVSRAILVKDEKFYDRFDTAFAAYFRGVHKATADLRRDIAPDWLRQTLESSLTDEQRTAIEKMGWDELMETLKKRLDEQNERHEGGSKWIGTGGTSPFGNGGFNPQGIRIGKSGGGNKSAVKVWEERIWRDYDDNQEALGSRGMKMALRRLRRFAREGSAEELNLPGTIDATAANAGWLNIQMQPERHNHVKVLLLMDVGGSMDEHIRQVEDMFSAVKSEFKHLNFYYFHNCVYDFVWKNNQRRFSEKMPVWDLLRTYSRDTKLIFVGDATMSPYEIVQPGGSVEYHNEEAGAKWLQRLLQTFSKAVWINPEPQGLWQYRQSIAIVQQIIGPQRMVPLTLQGLESGMRLLSK